MNKTEIEWTTFSANPLKYREKRSGKVVWACVKKSPGCAHCYSEAIALRFDRGKVFSASNMEELEPFLNDAELKKMRTAKTIGGMLIAGSRCFLGDMTDLFGEWVPDDLLNRLFSEVLEVRTDVTWQLLTKRAERMHTYLSWRWGEGRIPSRHIHVGVSVEDQQRASERIPLLLQTPAAVRFLSVEPLLGPVDIRPWLPCPRSNGTLAGYWYEMDPDTPRVRWVIIGGESGPHARPCNLAWIRSLLEQCRAAGVPVFVKQLGSRPLRPEPYHGMAEYPYSSAKGGDPAEWPADLRVRQFPEPAR